MIRIKSYDQLILNSFSRIKDGFCFDENYQPYTKDFLQKVIEYFKEREEYEKCQLVKAILDKRFNHDDGFKYF